MDLRLVVEPVLEAIISLRDSGAALAYRQLQFFDELGVLGRGDARLHTNTSRSVDCSGWIPVNLNVISSGSPIPVLPVDPINSGSNMYMYAASSTTYYKLATKMESTKYQQNGSNDVVSNDGGNSPTTL